MFDSPNAGNCAFYLRQAGDADPDRPEIASVMATVGVGYALLAIADAINNHAEAVADQQAGGDSGRR